MKGWLLAFGRREATADTLLQRERERERKKERGKEHLLSVDGSAAAEVRVRVKAKMNCFCNVINISLSIMRSQAEPRAAETKLTCAKDDLLKLQWSKPVTMNYSWTHLKLIIHSLLT